MSRATIMDVAQRAGVSRGTVSRVLNGSPSVSSAARKAVEKAVVDCNYRANLHARSLASGRTDTLAVLLTQPQSELFDDPTFSLLLQGVSNGLAGTETALVLLLAGNDEERRRTARFLDSRHIDGVVHLSPHINDPMLDAIIAADVPVVVCGEPPVGVRHPRLWSVTVTDKQGSIEAVSHLLQRGARTVGMIAGPADAPGSIQRIAGYRQALGEAYADDLIVHGDYGPDSGRTGLATLLERHPDLDAVFCASDRMAAGAYETAREAGLRIPDDLRIVGFDGHSLGLDLHPQLTSVQQPMRELGRAAVHMLIESAHGNNPGHRVFPTELVIRASS